MLKKGVWRKTASEAVSLHQDQALRITILLLKTYGPTGFLLREDGDPRDFKVFLGEPHSCNCPVFVKEQEPCKHICWLLLRKFRLPREHEYCFQVGLSERQMSELLEGSHQTRPRPSPDGSKSPPLSECGGVVQKPIQSQDVCPICQEDLLEKRLPVCYCRFSCGNNVHLSCMKVWAEHQKRSDSDEMVRCPLCREHFSSARTLWEQLKNARRLHTAAERERPDRHLGLSCQGCGVEPITGRCFKCTVCRYVYLCETCSERGCHPQHQFAFRSKRKEEWSLVSKGPHGAAFANDRLPFPQDPLPEGGLVHLSVVQVRAGSQLLDEGLQCRLCLQSFTLGQRVRSLTCCHKFHASCIDGILRTAHSCPLDGYVIYNPRMWRACERKTATKIMLDKSNTDKNYKDLFVPGVALQDRKQLHQLEVLPNCTGTECDVTRTHLGEANSGHSVKKSESKSASSSAQANVEPPYSSLYVGVTKPKPQVKVFECRRVRAPPKTRSKDVPPVPSELTMTGVVLGTQRKSKT